MRIQDLENRTGLERPTIRFYERQGLLMPMRLENGYREYTEEDVQQLMKIKLLRQLGMSVEKIKALQQGSVDFQKAMTAQIAHLGSRIDENKRARAVCEAISSDGVDYQSMNADHYLKMMREIRIDDRVLANTKFREDIPREIHPIRRFFARIMDISLFSLLMRFLLLVVLRIRPVPGEFLGTLLSIGFCFLYVPVEALMLHKWGTTPGKWAMGIRLEYIRGGNLPFSDAMRRSRLVLMKGMGCGIPFVQTICNLYSFCKLTGRAFFRWQKYNEIDPPTEMTWDEDTEIIYRDWNWEGKWLIRLLPLAAVWALLFSVTMCDIVKPTNRGDVTIAQFAENYNDTLRFLDSNAESHHKLQSDGTWTPVPDNVHIVYFGGESAGGDRPNFTYETDNGIVRSICYENSWTDIFYMSPVSGYCQKAAITALVTQNGCGIAEVYEFMQLWESKLNEQDTVFTYENIEIQWEIDVENAIYSAGTIFRDDQDAESAVNFRFEIFIHEQ